MSEIAIFGLVISGVWVLAGFIELCFPWLRDDPSGQKTFMGIIKALAFFIVCLYFVLRGLK